MIYILKWNLKIKINVNHHQGALSLDQKMFKIYLKNNRSSRCNIYIINLNLYIFMISAGYGDKEDLKIAEDDTWG